MEPGGTVYWDDLDFREKPPQAKLKGKVVKASEERLADTGLSEILAKKKPLEASVAIRNGSPVLLINGKQEPFVPFYAQNPEMAGTARRQGAGILVAKVPLNNWEQPTGSIWTGPDQYDFSVLDRCLSRLLSALPMQKSLSVSTAWHTGILRKIIPNPHGSPAEANAADGSSTMYRSSLILLFPMPCAVKRENSCVDSENILPDRFMEKL